MPRSKKTGLPLDQFTQLSDEFLHRQRSFTGDIIQRPRLIPIDPELARLEPFTAKDFLYGDACFHNLPSQFHRFLRIRESSSESPENAAAGQQMEEAAGLEQEEEHVEYGNHFIGRIASS